MNHDEMIGLIAAHRDGKTIQWRRDSHGWIDHDHLKEWKTLFMLVQNGYDLRIKPVATKRMRTESELPSNFWIKINGEGSPCVALCIDTGGVYIYGSPQPRRISWSELEDWQYSEDRKAWHSFYIEEESK